LTPETIEKIHGVIERWLVVQNKRLEDGLVDLDKLHEHRESLAYQKSLKQLLEHLMRFIKGERDYALQDYLDTVPERGVINELNISNSLMLYKTRLIATDAQLTHVGVDISTLPQLRALKEEIKQTIKFFEKLLLHVQGAETFSIEGLLQE